MTTLSAQAWKGAAAVTNYTEDVRMSKIIERQLVGNGKVTYFELRNATTFLSTAPVGFLRCEAVAVTDSGLCAKKVYRPWGDYTKGMWNKVHDKRAVVAWLIRHGHPIPRALSATAREMEM